MKPLPTTTLMAALATNVLAGPDALVDIPSVAPDHDPFADVRRPISNPVRFDDSFSTTAFASAHLSYEVSPWFIPLVEVNWFTVLDEGDGASRFTDQVGGAAPGLATFEGADLINWGAASGSDNDYVTAAVGFRSRLTERLDIGFAYEDPLTDEEENITEERFTLDATITF